jgi:uncharacterized membrane protein
MFTAWGLILSWNSATRKPHIQWSTAILFATILIGFGVFNLVEGIVDHHLFGLHHVNETVRAEYWLYWDLGFLLWGADMLLTGLGLLHRARGASRREQSR